MKNFDGILIKPVLAPMPLASSWYEMVPLVGILSNNPHLMNSLMAANLDRWTIWSITLSRGSLSSESKEYVDSIMPAWSCLAVGLTRRVSAEDRSCRATVSILSARNMALCPDCWAIVNASKLVCLCLCGSAGGDGGENSREQERKGWNKKMKPGDSRPARTCWAGHCSHLFIFLTLFTALQQVSDTNRVRTWQTLRPDISFNLRL